LQQRLQERTWADEELWEDIQKWCHEEPSDFGPFFSILQQTEAECLEAPVYAQIKGVLTPFVAFEDSPEVTQQLQRAQEVGCTTVDSLLCSRLFQGALRERYTEEKAATEARCLAIQEKLAPIPSKERLIAWRAAVWKREMEYMESEEVHESPDYEVLLDSISAFLTALRDEGWGVNGLQEHVDALEVLFKTVQEIDSDCAGFEAVASLVQEAEKVCSEDPTYADINTASLLEGFDDRIKPTLAYKHSQRLQGLAEEPFYTSAPKLDFLVLIQRPMLEAEKGVEDKALEAIRQETDNIPLAKSLELWRSAVFQRQKDRIHETFLPGNRIETFLALSRFLEEKTWASRALHERMNAIYLEDREGLKDFFAIVQEAETSCLQEAKYATLNACFQHYPRPDNERAAQRLKRAQLFGCDTFDPLLAMRFSPEYIFESLESDLRNGKALYEEARKVVLSQDLLTLVLSACRAGRHDFVWERMLDSGIIALKAPLIPNTFSKLLESRGQPWWKQHFYIPLIKFYQLSPGTEKLFITETTNPEIQALQDVFEGLIGEVLDPFFAQVISPILNDEASGAP
jgi:hypothetical protein